MEISKRYLGDGVYASWDGFQIWLTTDRESCTHRIALEAGTYDSLTRYVKDIGNANRAHAGLPSKED